MRTIRLMPHSVADAKCWNPGPWLMRYPESDPVEAPKYISDFDYGLELEFGFRAEIDLARVHERTGLDLTSTVATYATVDCAASAIRLGSTSTPQNGEVELWLRALPGVLAGSVELGRGLVTLDAGEAQGGFLPSRVGSRLLDDAARTVVLEGDLSRFPVEAADFRNTRHPDAAAWVLEATYVQPSDSFLGSVRLLVNSSHPAGRAVLAREHRIEHVLYRSALRVDIARQLFAVLARDDEAASTADVREDSVLGVASALSENVLKIDLASALRVAAEDPARFDGMVQQGFRYFDSES